MNTIVLCIRVENGFIYKTMFFVPLNDVAKSIVKISHTLCCPVVVLCEQSPVYLIDCGCHQ